MQTIIPERQYALYPRVGVGILVFKEDQFLLICRGTPPSKGLWTLPGGMIELGETMIQAAEREIQEECGIQVCVGDIVHVFDFIERDSSEKIRYHYVIVDFVGEYIGGQLQAGSDVVDARWFTLATMGEVEVPLRTQRLIHDVCRKK